MTRLEDLPAEILLMIIRQSGREDAKRFSQVSKSFYELAKEELWGFLTVRPRDNHIPSLLNSGGLSPEHLRLVKELYFRARSCGGGDPSWCENCPHETDERFHTNSSADHSDTDTEPYAAAGRRRDYQRLEKGAISMLAQLEAGQLRAFGWELGTCVPTQILGPAGIIPLRHPTITSLTLTTRHRCDPARASITLDAFKHLQRLTWRTPRPTDIETLAAAVERNAKHLEELELTLMHWVLMRPLPVAPQGELSSPLNDDEPPTAGDSPIPSGTGSEPPSLLGGTEEEIEENVANPTSRAKGYSFDQQILRRGRIGRSPLMLPALRVLKLSSVLLDYGSLDFPTLESLTLRKCPGWDTYLASALRLRGTLRLRTLEVAADHTTPGFGYEALLEFLGAFGTLEELFVSLPPPEGDPRPGLWGCAARHHPRLRRLVTHPKGFSYVPGSPLRRGAMHGCDLPTMGFLGSHLARLGECPSQNPLAGLNLEGIGLACRPEYLPYILRPFMLRSSLRIIHVRQSYDDLREAPNSATDALPNPRGEASASWTEAVWRESGASSDTMLPELRKASEYRTKDEEKGSTEGGGEGAAGMQPSEHREEFLQFVRFVFSPAGMPSLQVLLCGNFEHGSWGRPGNSVFVRSDAACGFRYVNAEGKERRGVLEEYGDMIGACPSKPFRWD